MPVEGPWAPRNRHCEILPLACRESAMAIWRGQIAPDKRTAEWDQIQQNQCKMGPNLAPIWPKSDPNWPKSGNIAHTCAHVLNCAQLSAIGLGAIAQCASERNIGRKCAIGLVCASENKCASAQLDYAQAKKSARVRNWTMGKRKKGRKCAIGLLCANKKECAIAQCASVIGA